MVVRVSGPAGAPAAADGHPETRHGVPEGAEGETEADLPEESQRAPLAPHAPLRQAAKGVIPQGLQVTTGQGLGPCPHASRDTSARILPISFFNAATSL